MQIADQMALEGGVVTVEVIRDGKHGPEVIARRVSKNLVVAGGKIHNWRALTGLSTKLCDQMRIGTSPAAAASNQTNVLSPVAGTLTTADSISVLAGTRTLQMIVSYPSGAGSKSATNICEVAILSQGTSPGGTMLARATFTPVTKTTADKLAVSYRARIT